MSSSSSTSTPASASASTYEVSLTNAESESTQTKIDSVVFSILQKFVQRADFGFKKYGTNLDRTDLSILDWIIHAQEEHMDAILYLEKLKKTYMESDAIKINESHATDEKLEAVENLEKNVAFSTESKKTYEKYEGIHSVLEGTYS